MDRREQLKKRLKIARDKCTDIKNQIRAAKAFSRRYWGGWGADVGLSKKLAEAEAYRDEIHGALLLLEMQDPNCPPKVHHQAAIIAFRKLTK
jgi:hypothetical protein